MGFINCMTDCINLVLTPPTPTNMVLKVLLNQHKQGFRDGNANMWECSEGAGEENVGDNYSSKTGGGQRAL